LKVLEQISSSNCYPLTKASILDTKFSKMPSSLDLPFELVPIKLLQPPRGS
jgi:hypothetical protein